MQWQKEKLPLKLRKSSERANLSHHQQAALFLLLADLLAVGFSIRHALNFIGTVKPKMLPWVTCIDQRMKNGTNFAQSLRKEVKADLYYQLLLAEKHGNLTQTLTEVGKLMTAQEKQRKKLLGLLQYPLILLIMLAVVISCLVLFIFPELKMWQETNNSPAFLKWASLSGSYLFALFFILGLCQWWHWQKMSKEQKLIKICKMPIIGKCYCYYYQYYLTSILGMMVKEGMSLAEICQLTQEFHRDSILYIFGKKAINILQQGGNLANVIVDYPFLPNELIIFMNKGMTLEKIGQDLTIFAQLQFKTLTNSIERLLIYVQPIIFSVIAIVIVCLYLSILLPIYHSFQGVY